MGAANPSSGPPGDAIATVLLADRDPAVRVGLRRLLADEPDLQVVAEAASHEEAISAARRTWPELAIVDSAIGPGGVHGLVQALLEAAPRIRVLIVSADSAAEQVRAAFDAGAVGYVHKFPRRADLVYAIRQAARGETTVCPEVTDVMVHAWLAGPTLERAAPVELSEEERRVIRLIALGAPTREIAEQLQRGIKAVEKYRVNLMRRLGLKNAAAVTQFAISAGLLSPGELAGVERPPAQP